MPSDRGQIEEIKERINILEVAQTYIPKFKKSGNNYFGICPFHSEKTPSFSVNPDMGIYKCFGCGESGDVITLIQKLEGVDFPKALEIAAKRAGVTLQKNFSPKDEQTYKERQAILTINSLVAEYYNYVLLKHNSGKLGREYAKNRGITKRLIEQFKIGYAPSGYQNLLNFLKRRGYKISDLVRWGLVVSGRGQVYDKFRSRLIFPLINQHDEIVGFSGRITIKNTKAPKYLHSPQTLAFDKSSFLFGISSAKTEMRKKDFVVFTEGQLDVISSYKTKVTNVVASLGTSLSPKQLEVAKRYTSNIYFSFDTDIAGETALIRSVGLAHEVGMSVKAITLLEGKDADELIQKSQSDWEKAVKTAEPIVDHMITRLMRRLDLSSLEDKEKFAAIILPIVAKYPKKIEQAYYLKKIAVILNVNEDILQEEMSKLARESGIVSHADTQRIKKVLESPINVKEEYLLAEVLQHPQFIDIGVRVLKTRYFVSPASRELLKKLKKYRKEKERFSLKNFISSLEPHEAAFVQNLLLQKLDNFFEIEDEFKEELNKVIKFLKKIYLQNKVKVIKMQIEDAEKAGESEKIDELLTKLVEVNDQIGNT